MNSIIATLAKLLGYIMNFCYTLLQDYSFAIIFFTLLTKIILLPISIWVHKNGIKMVSLMPALNRIKAKYFGDGDTIAEEQHSLYKREKYHPLASIVPMFVQIILLIAMIRVINDNLGGTNLILIPIEAKGLYLLMPLAAGISAYILSITQDRINPLQREQIRSSQIATMAFSVGISLFLGAFVSIGVGLYWICSNLFTILQQLFLNTIIPPKKHIDYVELEQSKKALQEINNLGSKNKKKWFEKDPDKKREKADYKRFFSIANKHLVFYSEKSGFYKYFENVINELIRRSNIVIHYVTSDPNDQIFNIAEKQPRIKPYYIGEKRLITLMMKMDADMVVMTMPDLNKFHYKRSYVRKDIEYVYMCHGVGSTNLLLRKGALDHYDTIFCVGQYQMKELEEEAEVYNLSNRRLFPCGYGLIDNTINRFNKMERIQNSKPQILIAPSWQVDNIMESCIDEILNEILTGEFRVIVRPHPEFIKRYPHHIEKFMRTYQEKFSEDFIFQTDFSSNETVFMSDILITDWSTISYEFSYATKKPTLFINTPMKVMNPEYKKLKTVPLDIYARDVLGISLELNELNILHEKITYLISHEKVYQEKIETLLKATIYNIGNSGKVGCKYILTTLSKKQNKI